MEARRQHDRGAELGLRDSHARRLAPEFMPLTPEFDVFHFDFDRDPARIRLPVEVNGAVDV